MGALRDKASLFALSLLFGHSFYKRISRTKWEDDAAVSYVYATALRSPSIRKEKNASGGCII